MGGDEEVSWLGVVDRGAFPARPSADAGRRASGACRGLTAHSCGGSAGFAPDFPVSSRAPTLARRRSRRQSEAVTPS
jgi:hypothetical protein